MNRNSSTHICSGWMGRPPISRPAGPVRDSHSTANVPRTIRWFTCRLCRVWATWIGRHPAVPAQIRLPSVRSGGPRRTSNLRYLRTGPCTQPTSCPQLVLHGVGGAQRCVPPTQFYARIIRSRASRNDQGAAQYYSQSTSSRCRRDGPARRIGRG